MSVAILADRVAKSDDPRDPGSCKILGVCVKIFVEEKNFSAVLL